MRSFFRNMLIARRIALAFGVLLLLAGAGGVMALLTMQQLSEELSEIVTNYNEKIRLASEVRDEGRQRAEQIRNMLLTEEEEKIEEYKALFDASVERYTALILELDELISEEEEQLMMDRIRSSSAATFPVMNVMMQNIMDGFGEDSLETLQNEGAALQSELLEALTAFVRLEQGRIDQASSEAERAAREGLLVVLATSGAIFLFILVIWYLLSRSLTVPLQGIVQIMDSLRENGDFSVRCKDHGRSELGLMASGFNDLMDSLQGNIDAIRHGMGEIASGRLGVQIESDARGDLAELRDNINGTVLSIGETVGAIRAVMQNVAEGRFDRTVESGARGDLAELGESVNETISTLNGAIGSIDQVMGAVANGDFSARVDLELSGDLNGLKQHLNTSLDALGEALERSVRVAVAQSEGDLASRVEGEYSGQLAVLKAAINGSQEKVSGAIGEIATTAGAVAGAGEQIYQTSTDLSQRSQEQAASIEETAASMEEMTASVKQNSDNAGQADQLATTARGLAEEGGTVMDRATSAMNAISESSQKISDIISVIDGIAFQTNLLALNAAVEAARAGEQGRGFAVVAGEVRTLAQRSADAAKEISSLIADSTEKVQEGAGLVDEAGHSLGEIVHGIKKVSDIVAEIAAASAEQTSGIEQVNNAIAQMEGLTQDNVELVEKAAAASESMKQQADGMRELVSFFKVEEVELSSVEGAAERAESAHSVVEGGHVEGGQDTEDAAQQATHPAPARPSSTPRRVESDTEWDEF